MADYLMPVSILDPSNIRDLSPDVLDDTGRLKVMPAEYWAGTTREERALFGGRRGLYSFPTVELVEYLGNAINGRRAIEIGAGHGVLAEALGITATDSYQQRKPKYRKIYEDAGQTIVPYGPNVERMDAREAISRYHPEVVIGAWVTHKYNPAQHWDGGNEEGVDEAHIVKNVKLYVAIGNQKVHRGKAIWSQLHLIMYPKWVWSRAMNGSPDFVARWDRV